jgi:hypothetical protein
MATWNDLRNFMFSNYVISHDEGDHIVLKFQTENLRSQMVHLFRDVDGIGNEWVDISSAIGEWGRGSIEPLLRMVDSRICGGLSLVDNLLVYRHCVPLISADADDIMGPMAVVAGVADEMERMYTGQDGY